MFEPATFSWTDLTQDTIGISPIARENAGLLAMANSSLYLFGGYTDGGKSPFTRDQNCRP
jgi:hypothetical protein